MKEGKKMDSDQRMEQLQQEIEKHIEEMEQPGYRFPKRFSRRDYVIAGLVAFGCLLLLVAGAYL